MGEQSYQPRTFVDFIASAEAGMNSGVSPLLLEKNQIGVGINCSLRGGFLNTRPPFQLKVLDYGGDTTLQSLVETGKFQGAGYYRPDYGTESLLAQISGHLIKFTESGDSWVVSDVSIIGDLNSTSPNQVWMWQAEKWMIIQDGTGVLPIFYDGNSSRRSNGSVEKSVATLSAEFTTSNPRVIGEIITLAIAGSYVGKAGDGVIFNEEFYQVADSSSPVAGAYGVVCANVNSPAGIVIPSGSQVIRYESGAASNTAGAATVTQTSESQGAYNLPTLIYEATKTEYIPAPTDLREKYSYTITAPSSSKRKISAGTSLSITLALPATSSLSAGSVFNLTFSQNYTSVSTATPSPYTNFPTSWPSISHSTAVSTGVNTVSGQLRVVSISADRKTLDCEVVADIFGVLEFSYAGQTLVNPTLSWTAPGGYSGTFSGATGTYTIQPLSMTAEDLSILSQSVAISVDGTNYVLGKTKQDFTAPEISSSGIIYLDFVYSGADSFLVSIFGYDFRINTYIQNDTPGVLKLINLTDTVSATLPIGTEVFTVPEISSGRVGSYGQSRNWFSTIDGTSYLAGDIVGGASGTPANDYRDSVLKTTENDFLSGGGKFRLPGSGDFITAMFFPPVLDTSLGQGPLQISTQKSIFSNNSPVDRATWVATTNPLQTETLKDKGALGQNSCALVNSDTFFRCSDGIGTLVMARRYFGDWGNKVISNEVQRLIFQDDISLLSFGSAISFDNRMLMTVRPKLTSRGVCHAGIVSLSFDVLSSLRTNLPPVWEGVWTGINTLQLLAGRVSGSNRAFAFTYNQSSLKNELVELLPENTTVTKDFGTTSIKQAFETPIAFGKEVKPLPTLCQLRDGEVYLSDIVGEVTVKVFYRPDFYPGWTLWNEFTVTTDENYQPGYRMRAGLGEPSSADAEAGNNRPLRIGQFFQFRVEITGSCVWNGIKCSSIEIPQTMFAQLVQTGEAVQRIDTTAPDDLALYTPQGSIL